MKRKLTKGEVSQILEEFYSSQSTWKPVKDSIFTERVITASITNIAMVEDSEGNIIPAEVDASGLGDCVIMTAVTPEVKISSCHKQYLPMYSPPILYEMLNSSRVEEKIFSGKDPLKLPEISFYDWGGGHCIQRTQRAMGLEVSLKPQGKIKFLEKKVSKKVFVHLKNGTDYKRTIPNSLDQDSMKTIFDFFEKADLSFFYFKNNLALEELISEMETCEFFLGIDSGPMHIAAAMGLKSVIIINDPSSSIYLPKIKECEIPNSEWLYPQNVHLNRSGKSQLVPEFTLENLEKAFSGEVYPYWSDQFLELFPR